MTDFSAKPCPACDYRDGVLVRQCEQCRQAMSPPAAGDHLHIPTLQAVCRVLCYRCQRYESVAHERYVGSLNFWHPPDRSGTRRCFAADIHAMIAHEKEAQHDPR